MKRCLLLSALLCLFSVTHMYAETTTPSITLTTTKTDVIEMKFGCRTAHTIHIDWGDGKLVETVEIADSATVYPKASSATIYPTAVTGTPVNGGKIKIYADDIKFFVIDADQQITELNVTGATELGYIKVNKNSITAIDLSKNNQLEYVNLDDNKLETLTLGDAPNLTQLLASGMSIAKIKLTGCPSLVNVNLADNKITTIDVSANTKMTTLALTNNLLTDIDCSMCESLKFLRLSGNRFAAANSVIFPTSSANLTQVLLKDNYFKLSTLPVTKAKSYTYYPQNPYPSPKEIALGGTVNLSSELKLQGLSDKEETTTYRWIKKEDNTILTPGTDYTEVSAGVFKFDKELSDTIYCVMSTNAFPKFTGTTNSYKTDLSVVVTEAAITLNTTKAEEVELQLGCATGHKVFIDWGDGMPVETVEINDSLAVFGQNTMKPTVVTGIPKGTMKIYGRDMLYFGADEQEVTSIDVTKAVQLGVLKVPTNKLGELNVTNNEELYYIYAEENELSALDATHCPKLIWLSANENKIESVDLTVCSDLYNLNLSENLLSSIDLSVCNDLGPCRLSNNNLEEIIMPSEGVAPTTTLDVKNNKLTISTLPEKTLGMSSASRLTYAPQAPYVLPKDITAGAIVDLSSELKAIGVSDKEETTTYTWRLKTSGTALQKDVDYTEKDGVFTFTGTELADSVYCIMATAAYPKFTGTANMFKTTNVHITVPAGVKENTVSDKIVTTGNGLIKVLNIANNDVIEIFSLNGALVTMRKASENMETIKVVPGSYIVKIGDKRCSVIVP